MNNITLKSLGWRPQFAAQLASGGDAEMLPARAMAVHRNRIDVAGEGYESSVELTGRSAALDITVGDWLLLGNSGSEILQRLDRFGVFQRRAPGSGSASQAIAANVDTLFIVTAAGREFNTARLERYLAVAHDAGAYPLIVITKADTVDSVAELTAAAYRLTPGLVVEALDARDPEQVAALRPWCDPGQTVALVGSSGVGKSTLIGTLTGIELEIGSVREDDQHGRHTTTRRSMHPIPDGGWLIDTPGMRELQLVDIGDSLAEVFADIAELSRQCRFADCGHQNEPSCAVLTAIAAGELEEGRLARFQKLLHEDRRNSESLAERRARDRSTGKLYKSIQDGKRRDKSGD